MYFIVLSIFIAEYWILSNLLNSQAANDYRIIIEINEVCDMDSLAKA